MKKTIITSMTLVSLSAGIFLYSCKKEAAIQPQNPANGVSVYENENGKFKKEIVVKDESGKNSLYLAVYSDYQSAIDEYLKNTELKLIIEKEDPIERLKGKANESSKIINDKNIEMPIPEVKKEHSVTVDVITSNFEENVKGYSLDVKVSRPPIDPKHPNVNYEAGSSAEYPTASDFCGVVHLGWGLDIAVEMFYKPNGWSGWQMVGGGYFTGNSNNPADYSCYIIRNSSYRTMAKVTLDKNQGTVNYRVAFQQWDYRGHDCTIGTYDGTDCYYGTPPSGTNAFIWTAWGGGFPPTYTKHFYYTPVSGNQCPRPGSWFDGSNCHVLDVPNSCEPFIWNNKWYVRPDLLSL